MLCLMKIIGPHGIMDIDVLYTICTLICDLIVHRDSVSVRNYKEYQQHMLKTSWQSFVFPKAWLLYAGNGYERKLCFVPFGTRCDCTSARAHTCMCSTSGLYGKSSSSPRSPIKTKARVLYFTYTCARFMYTYPIYIIARTRACVCLFWHFVWKVQQMEEKYY